MNCPVCNTKCPEGKKFCADCGASLDPDARRLDALIESKLEALIGEKLGDKTVVEIETTQSVIERIEKWSKLFGFFVGIPFALFVLWLGIAGFGKYSDFKEKIAQLELKINPQIERAKADAEQAERISTEAKKKAVESQTTIDQVASQIKRQLGSATKTTQDVQQLSERVTKVQKESSENIAKSVADLNLRIEVASKNIAAQEKKLESTDELVKTILSKGTTEFFQTSSNGANVVFIGSGNHVVVYLLLKKVPIQQTVELKYYIYSQPKNSYVIVNNLLIFNWGQTIEQLRQYPLEVSYTPDPTATTLPYQVLSLKDNALYVDNKKF